MSLSRDNSHSWVRISHGSNKFVMDLNNNDTEIPQDQLEDQALQLDAKDFVKRLKAKAKPQRKEPAGSSSRISPMERRNWIDIEPGKHSLSEYEVSKKVIHLLRHSQKVHREEDGAVHFWRIKENLQNPLPQSIHWSDDRWKAYLAAGGGAKRRFQYCTDDSGIIIYFRSLQGHSGRNLIDLSLQDNVVIPSGFFQYIYHIGCGFNLHSIINSGLILGGQNSSKRQTVFFLLVDLMDKSHKDPDEIDLNVPRHAQYLHNAWKGHQDAVYWFDIDLAIQMSPRLPRKISLKHEWKRELGPKVARQPEGEVARQPEGEVARQAKFFQPTQPTPNPIRDRSGRPDDMQDGRNTSRSQEIDVHSFDEELSSSHRTERPVVSEDSMSLNVEQTHDRTGRLVAILHTAEAQDSSQVCSAHKGDTLNVDDEVLRKRKENPLLFMTRIMNR